MIHKNEAIPGTQRAQDEGKIQIKSYAHCGPRIASENRKRREILYHVFS